MNFIPFNGTTLGLISLIFQIGDRDTVTVTINGSDENEIPLGSFDLSERVIRWMQSDLPLYGHRFILHDIKRALKVQNLKVGDLSLDDWRSTLSPFKYIVKSTEGLRVDDIEAFIEYITHVFAPSDDVERYREEDTVVYRALQFAKLAVNREVNWEELITEYLGYLGNRDRVILPIIDCNHAVYAVITWLGGDQFEVCICNGGKSLYLFHQFCGKEWKQLNKREKYLGACIFTCNTDQLKDLVTLIDRNWNKWHLLQRIFMHLSLTFSKVNPRELFHGTHERYESLEVCVKKQTVGNCAIHNLWQAVRHCAVAYISTTGGSTEHSLWHLRKKAMLGEHLIRTVQGKREEIINCTNNVTFDHANEMATEINRAYAEPF